MFRQNTERYQPPSEDAFQMAFKITDLSELKSKACQVILSEILLRPHKTDGTDQYKDMTSFCLFFSFVESQQINRIVVLIFCTQTIEKPIQRVFL